MIDDRFELRAAADERTVLTVFLDWHRGRLVHKCAGLSDDQLRSRPVPSSNLSLLGLMRHLAGVERWWIQTVIGGERRDPLFPSDDDDADFNELDEATGEGTFALWRAEVDQSRRVVAKLPLEAVGKPVHRRRVLAALGVQPHDRRVRAAQRACRPAARGDRRRARRIAAQAAVH